MNKILLFGIICFFPLFVCGQANRTNSLFFLNFALDGRSTGMGDAGVATSPDTYSHTLNPSKYIFGKTKAGLNLAYSPWIPELVNDMSISELSGYFLLDEVQSISSSFRLFSMGEISWRDGNEQPMGSSSPFQMAVDFAYSRQLGKNISMGIALRYIHSNFYHKSDAYEVGKAVAADLSTFYNKEILLNGHSYQLSFGGILSNLGTKVKYSNTLSEFLPMQLKIGTSLATEVSPMSRLMFTAELHNNLYPLGEDNNQSILEAVFNSFQNTTSNTLSWNFGTEYTLKEAFFGRVGYYKQGNSYFSRKYFTLGAGLKYKKIQFDISYLFPIGSYYHSMNNTFRLSISLTL